MMSEKTALCVFATAVTFFANVTAEAVLNCTAGASGNEYIADDVDLCIYYHCRNGRPTDGWPTECAKGTRLPSYYNKSTDNPCTELVSGSKCLRCDISDVQRKPNIVTDYCTLWKPCDAGCKCHNEVEGYWCECGQSLTTLPVLPTSTYKCGNSGYCLNGGECYKLYDAEPFCECLPGWTGKRCERSLCQPDTCKNGGTCVLNGTRISCICQKCFTGTCCEARDTYDDDCIGCDECDSALLCTGKPSVCVQTDNCKASNRTWLCKCNPCADSTYQCADVRKPGTRRCTPGAGTTGSRFTLMFEENAAESGTAELEVYVSADVPGENRVVNISAPLGQGKCKISNVTAIPAGQIAKFGVPIECRHNGYGGQRFGIRVEEVNNKGVTVYGVNRALFSADSFLALPDELAGMEFVVLCYPNLKTARSNKTFHGVTQFGIVAIENRTQVNVTLSAPTAILGTVNDTTYIIQLNAYETYQFQSSNLGGDLSGSIIISSNPIHVYSGNRRASVILGRTPSNDKTLSTDHLVEEVPPATTWGTFFAIIPIPRTELNYTQTLDVVRLVGATDTDCTLYSSSSKIVYHYDVYTEWLIEFTVDASDNYVLNCTDPVLIMLVTSSADENKGETVNGVEGYRLDDPAMMYVPATSQYSNYYMFAPPRTSSDKPYNTTLAILAANSTTYSLIKVNNVTTSKLIQFKRWEPIAPQESALPHLFGGIFRISNVETSIIGTDDRHLRFMCIIYCYDDRESIGHVAGSALSFTYDLTEAASRSRTQWTYIKNLTSVQLPSFP